MTDDEMGVDLATNDMRKLVYKRKIATNEVVIIGINSGTFRDRRRLPTGIVGGSRPWESRVFPGSSTSEVSVFQSPTSACSHVQARAPSSSHPTERFRHCKDGEYQTGQFPSCESPHRFYCRTSIRYILLWINMTQEILPFRPWNSVAGQHLLFHRMLTTPRYIHSVLDYSLGFLITY